jgi:DHA1 family inner membrane transport protein
LPPLLYLLAACNLVIGTSAFCLTGILQPVATSLGVGVSAVGQTMTAYAMATALLAPLLLVATGRWPRRTTLQLALGLFGLGMLRCALAGSLRTMLAGRILMGAGAVFTPIAASIAVSVVEPARQGKALSLTFLGISMSYVVGLPLGAWLGLEYGWRVPVLGLAALCAVMAVLVGWLVPARVQAPGASFIGLGTLLRHPDVVRCLLLTLCYFSAIFTVFSYIGPVLQALNPMGARTLSLTLMTFGLAGVCGTISGGWASDRFGPVRALRVQLAVLATMMLLVPLTHGSYPQMMAVLVLWGLAGFGMMSPTQARLAAAAPRQTPILFSLNTSMLYFGTAFGAAVGGGVGATIGYGALSWVGAGFALLGSLTFIAARR